MSHQYLPTGCLWMWKAAGWGGNWAKSQRGTGSSTTSSATKPHPDCKSCKSIMPTGCWVAKAGQKEFIFFAFLSKPQDHFLARYPKNDRQGQGCRVPGKRLPSPKDHRC